RELTALLWRNALRSGACGASTRVELAPPWTPQPPRSPWTNIELGPPGLGAQVGDFCVRLAQAVGQRLAEAAIDLDGQLVVGGEQLLEFLARNHQQLHLTLGHHVG